LPLVKFVDAVVVFMKAVVWILINYPKQNEEAWGKPYG
jgi:hypothetical protein